MSVVPIPDCAHEVHSMVHVEISWRNSMLSVGSLWASWIWMLTTFANGHLCTKAKKSWKCSILNRIPKQSIMFIHDVTSEEFKLTIPGNPLQKGRASSLWMHRIWTECTNVACECLSAFHSKKVFAKEKEGETGFICMRASFILCVRIEVHPFTFAGGSFLLESYPLPFQVSFTYVHCIVHWCDIICAAAFKKQFES